MGGLGWILSHFKEKKPRRDQSERGGELCLNCIKPRRDHRGPELRCPELVNCHFITRPKNCVGHDIECDCNGCIANCNCEICTIGKEIVDHYKPPRCFPPKSPHEHWPERTGITHNLKCWPSPFDAIKKGLKRHELRKNDRDYKAGDVLYLKEWDPQTGQYSGDSLYCFVIYITDHFKGLKKGYVIMSINNETESHPAGE